MPHAGGDVRHLRRGDAAHPSPWVAPQAGSQLPQPTQQDEVHAPPHVRRRRRAAPRETPLPDTEKTFPAKRPAGRCSVERSNSFFRVVCPILDVAKKKLGGSEFGGV